MYSGLMIGSNLGCSGVGFSNFSFITLPDVFRDVIQKKLYTIKKTYTKLHCFDLCFARVVKNVLSLSEALRENNGRLSKSSLNSQSHG